MAHEFAHHVQFERDLLTSPLTGAEATRRTELLADAMAACFATHSRGLALNAKRVVQAQEAFAQVGDCAFTDLNHHGAPLQRERVTLWGVGLADSARAGQAPAVAGGGPSVRRRAGGPRRRHALTPTT